MKRIITGSLLIFVLVGSIVILSSLKTLSAADGETLYNNHCGMCHPQGGTPMDPSLPVVGSAKMKSLDAFTAFNRKPVKADGSAGSMPAFPKDKISDEEMKLIYEYSLKLPGPKK